MPDLPSVTKLINSPPAQLVAGAALAGIVWKFFERGEGVLKDETKKKIARWWRVRNVETGLIAEKAEPWPETFAKIFDRVFGTKHLSWRCFGRSAIAATLATLLAACLSGNVSFSWNT